MVPVHDVCYCVQEGHLGASDPFVTFLQDAARSERKINDIETRRDMGLPVCFGDEIRLQHCESEYFVSSSSFTGKHAVLRLLHEIDAFCCSLSDCLPIRSQYDYLH